MDNTTLAIDQDLVLGLSRNLKDILRQNIIGIDGGIAKCADYLREQPAIVAKREELERKRSRLDAAKMELMQIF